MSSLFLIRDDNERYALLKHILETNTFPENRYNFPNNEAV